LRTLVTGASGFLGGHLVNALRLRGDEVFGFQRPGQDRREGVDFIGDILDANALERALISVKPDQLYHLAAQSLPIKSWADPITTFRANLEGTINVLDAVRKHSPFCKVVVTGSSAEYAETSDSRPIEETDEIGPSSPYGVSKAAASEMCRLYSRAHKVNVSIARPFFLIGAGKTGDVSSDWVQRLIRLEAIGGGELVVGHLDVVRDFLHVRDGVSGLMTIAAKGTAGETYNVSSGTGWRLSDFLDLFVTSVACKIVVRSQPDSNRRIDEKVKIGNSNKLRQLGWASRETIPTAVSEIFAAARARQES
jgi:GDP-4-dehydro-6-deoxy-D-mannose reductase